jgi:hypothetical protein
VAQELFIKSLATGSLPYPKGLLPVGRDFVNNSGGGRLLCAAAEWIRFGSRVRAR